METILRTVVAVLVSLGISIALVRPAEAGPPTSIPNRVAELEAMVADLQSKLLDLQAKLACVSNTSDHQDVYFDGCNVHVRNGLGGTDSVNGYGNLIVGYDEATVSGPGSAPFVCSDGAYQDYDSCTGAGGTWARGQKTGSHNLVVGSGHSYTQSAGVVFGAGNAVNRFAATVVGGYFNVASGQGSSTTAGLLNRSIGSYSSVTGGDTNWAYGSLSSISGGNGGQANGAQSSISGGWVNVTQAQYSSISGGRDGRTEALGSSISGGNRNRTYEGEDFAGTFASISGGLENQTNGVYASVSGGYRNQANGPTSTVGGGGNRVTHSDLDWRAGDLFEDN
jgi:hypothetical protein